MDIDRCSGNGHGQCQMGCALLWKTNWLAPSSQTSAVDSDEAAQYLQSRLDSNSSSTENGLPIFQCQATQFGKIATSHTKIDASRFRNEHDLNQISVAGLVTDFCSSVLAKASGRSKGFAGPCKKTPVNPLNLKVGEQVRVKSKKEIVQTLDASGKNRGLWFDPLMSRHCGEVLSVTRLVHRFIDERNGRLIKAKHPSIVLDDLHCNGRARHYCGRLLQFFWREAWLQRVE